VSETTFPQFRLLPGPGICYAVEGPKRLIEWRPRSDGWWRTDVVAREYPEQLLIRDLLACEEGRYATCTEEEVVLQVARGKVAGDGILPGMQPGVARCEPTADVDLSGLHTFGVPARAEFAVEVRTDGEVRAALQWAAERALPVLVLGGGSNVLFHRDVEGLVVLNRIGGTVVLADDGDRVEVAVGAGEPWHGFVVQATEAGWGGVENLALIPGSVGAAPMQNIGAYGAEVREVIAWVEAIDRRDGALQRFTPEECAFGYRESLFKQAGRDRYVIVRVGFHLRRSVEVRTGYGDIARELAGVEAPRPGDVAAAVIRIRRSKLPDPALLGNAGSFFKNPVLPAADFAVLRQAHPELPHWPAADGTVKVAAGWLIEQAGWKGHDRGTHGVHDRQALVLVHRGGATGADIWQLASDIRASVRERFGVDLEPEVNQIGLAAAAPQNSAQGK
jgi:UDP-N-acetylmuramate dehydrogenase